MINHVQVSVTHFGKSLRFYSEALRPLGYTAQSVDESAQSAGFGPPGAPKFWIGVGTPSKGPVHIAFDAPSTKAIAEFHAAALAAGGRDNGKPGPRPDYGPKYHAAFVIDPDGNNVEAVIS
jgi:catechol 2,3-dioxygenase-like lactoylglutathione lyase family enzyme